MLRGQLARLWRDARQKMDPISAREYISQTSELASSYKKRRGLGGFVRSTRREVNELVAAANNFTIKNMVPTVLLDFLLFRLCRWSATLPDLVIFLLLGCSAIFYDWYCDLPPASPQVWGEQTDVPESADWYNSTYLLVWGSNIPMTRTPDAHFMPKFVIKYKTVAVSSDYGEMVKFSDIWLSPKQGTDAALSMAMGHVIFKEFHLIVPLNILRHIAVNIQICQCWLCLMKRMANCFPDISCVPVIWQISLMKKQS